MPRSKAGCPMPELDQYAVVVKRNGPTFFAEVPDFPGCMTQGDSIGEVWAAIEDAKRLWVDRRIHHGEPIPPPAFYSDSR